MNRTYNIVPAQERNLDKYNTIGIHVLCKTNNHDTTLREAYFMQIMQEMEHVLCNAEYMFNATGTDNFYANVRACTMQYNATCIFYANVRTCVVQYNATYTFCAQ